MSSVAMYEVNYGTTHCWISLVGALEEAMNWKIGFRVIEEGDAQRNGAERSDLPYTDGNLSLSS